VIAVSYLTFTVDYPVRPVVPPPRLTLDYFTFGSLVTQYKITRQAVGAWAEIFRRATGSRLLLANLV